MANNLYELFGLDEGCTDEQLDEAYGRIRSKYAEDRFLEGEAGNEAARKLTEIDNAYRDIIALRRENAGGNSRSGDALKTIAENIKNGDLAGAQSDLDAQRLVDAGADRAQIAVTGSFKFDVAHRNPAKERELAAWVGASSILLGGSTWPGEDDVLLGIYADLVKTHPEVVLVIAPRHFEKADAVEANIRKAGFPCIRRSRGDRMDSVGEVAVPPVFLCDTTGEMMGLFGIATVVFVGKSLCAHGSQNMIEPCLCGKPTIVGPYTENFRPVMSDLLAADALVQVPDAAGLRREVFRFFDDPAARAAQGARATAAVTRRCGVVGRCADELLEALR